MYCRCVLGLYINFKQFTGPSSIISYITCYSNCGTVPNKPQMKWPSKKKPLKWVWWLLLAFSIDQWMMTLTNMLQTTFMPQMNLNQKGHSSERNPPETNIQPGASHSEACRVSPIQRSRGVGLHKRINFPILSISDLSQRSMPVIMHNMLWCTETTGHDSEWLMMNTPWATHISMTLYKPRLNIPTILLFLSAKPAH